jgi:MoxR-like ATPase
LPDISFDFAVMEKASGVRAVPLRAGWSDVGTWRAVRETRKPSDENGNLIFSDVPVLAIGVRDSAIVVAPDGVLVLPFRRGTRAQGRGGAAPARRKGTPQPGGHGLGPTRPAVIPAIIRYPGKDVRMTGNPSSGLDRLRGNVQLAYRGSRRAVDLMLTALFSRGHVLIEDVPGVGKTTLARALGRSLALEFRRIQFTSDTLPADVLGISVFQSTTERFEFHAGPIFANIVLADEINRATPKTQSALLEAMNEAAVTVDSQRRALPDPFMVVATQNPVEYLGTYPLPRVSDGPFLPTTDPRLSGGRGGEETPAARGTERALAAIPPVLSSEDVRTLQADVERVAVSDKLLDYLHALVEATRATSELRLPVSTRGAQALFRATQAHALLQGRDYATPDDAKSVAEPVLAHRILSVASDGFGAGGREREVIKKILSTVPVPV